MAHEGQYRCVDCKKSFKTNIALNDHKKAKHTTNKASNNSVVYCKKCDKQFSENNELKIHNDN